MIDKLITFALKQRLLTIAATLLMAAFGVFCMMSLPVDSFPDVSNIQVQIITDCETLATEEVESLITYPIEYSLSGLHKVTNIRSNSSFGLSVVTVIFEDDTDVYWARNLVQQRLSQVELPAWAPTPQLGPVVSTFSNVYNYYLKSDRHNLTELRTIQDWYLAKRLRSVQGVGNVVTYGGFVKQYQVLINPRLLAGYGITLHEVVNSLTQNNKNAGGNFIERASEEIIVRGLGRIETVTDIEEIVLKSVDGTPVYVRDVAKVVIGPAFRRGSASMNGQGEVVTGMVLTRKGVNTKAVVEKVRERIEELKHELPQGVQLIPYYDQTELVEKTIDTVKEILLFSGGLVIIVLTAILLHIPSGLIVSVIIPLSLLFSFIMMKYTGLSANLMTLGAVDFGVIVDASVVMVENIYRQLAEAHEHQTEDRHTNHFQVVLNAAKEVGRPIVFAIFIIVSVYLPLFTLEGIEGKMFHPLALTFIYAILGALLLSLTIVPVLCFWFLRGDIREKRNPIVDTAKRIHTPALSRSMKHPFATAFVCIGALVGSFCLVPFLGSEFIPTLDEGSILLRTKLSPSVAHTESMRIAQRVEETMKKFPEVTVVVSRIGRSGMGSDLEGVENADVYIGLKPKEQWTTTHDKEKLVNMMAKELEGIPGLIFSFSQPIADMIDDLIAGIKADLGIKVFGDDLETLDKLASDIETAIAEVPGCADLQREHILGLPQMTIKLDRNEMARYGLNVSDIQDVLQNAIAGNVVTDVIEGNMRFGMLTRLPKPQRDTQEEIENLIIDTPSGARVPLKSIADIRLPRGTAMINREETYRRTAVLANVRGRDLGSFVGEAMERIKKEVKIPKGYSLVFGGQFENQQRAMQRLAIVVPIVLALIFLLLYASFNSFKNAGLIMLNVPFAMVGGIIALFITHQTISVPAIIGFIALFGVAVQNGVILVTYIMQLQKQGHPVAQAAVEGAQIRLRPVLMTALVAIMGLLPKIFSNGTGAEVQRPLATVVLGGLVSATLLTLIVLPTVYALINKDKDTLETV
ncbi:MAG: CusA/CzcA family heavy metal efflux RND transporter [Cyanobacteria bacterium PR.3.49]|nr:CusA/CzcA family heavy metal efflux RND transporter [Cyanobacteria bacterium PR.3.49]